MLTLTETAVKQLKNILAEEGDAELALRVFVMPGGCSGLSYGMSLDKDKQPDDIELEWDGLRILVDEISAQYLVGAEIDYVNSLMGAGFTVHNPNAVRTCACGHSFDTGDNASTASPCCGH